MKFNLRRSLMCVAVSSLLAAPLAQATNGYFSDGTGAKNRGMGGAGVSLANETGNIVSNPATAVKMGERMDIGMGIFSPKPRTYTISGNDLGALGIGAGNGLDGTDESGRNYFLIPYYGQSFSIDSDSSWAFTVAALGGMNTDWKRNPFQPIGTAMGAGNLGNLGIDLKQVSVGGTYARKVTPELALGVTLALTIQEFQAHGIGIFGAFNLSSDPANLSDRGKSRSTGIGINLGALYDLGSGMSLGFNYSPEIDMSEFDEYKGLFAEGGDLDIPSHYSLGFSMQINPETLFAIDYRRINYTDVASISNDSARLTTFTPGAGCLSGDPTTCLGGANGAGFGWNDMDIIKFGVAWEQSPGMTYRAGWNHGDSPIEAADATINIIAPGVVEDHLTLGMTMALDSTSEISVDFIHAFANDVTGDVPAAFSTQNAFNLSGGMVANNPAGVPGTTTIEMEQNWLEVQYGKRF